MDFEVSNWLWYNLIGFHFENEVIVEQPVSIILQLIIIVILQFIIAFIAFQNHGEKQIHREILTKPGYVNIEGKGQEVWL